MIDRLLGKDAKPEEYDVNMHRNDVYNGIWCAFDCLFTLIIFDYLHYSMRHVVVKWSIVDDIVISECSTWYCE